MPATPLTKLAWTGPYPTALSTLTQTAATITTGNSFKMSGNDLLLVDGGSAGGTVTITGPVNKRNRTGTITTEAVAANAIRVFGPFKQLDGWLNSDGVRLVCSANTMKLSVIRLR